MVEKIFLFILCGIMCTHQILTYESSDHLIRKKRVINLEEGGDVPLPNGSAPFVVNIRLAPNNSNIGVGAILSKHTVITSAECVSNLQASAIKILVGSSLYYRGTQHDVVTKLIHLGNHRRTNTAGVALLTVAPRIVFDTRAALIPLHQGPILTGVPATIFGWGCNPVSPRGTNYRQQLRSITVPIMNHRDCVNSFQGYFVISDNDICTYHVNKRCGHTDSGAPLVINNQLAGLHVINTRIQGRITPDVYVLLQSLEYGPWIRSNIIHTVFRMSGGK